MEFPKEYHTGALGKFNAAKGELTDETTKEFLRKQMALCVDYVRKEDMASGD